MRFGLFGSAQAKRGGPDVDSGVGFREFVDYNVEAESLGFCSTFLVEHHFTGFGQISATLSLLTFIAARTKTLRPGAAVIVLPWHNPVLLAEQAATLDVLSQGRLDFGVGTGYRSREFAGFCMPMEEAAERFANPWKSFSRPGRRTRRGRIEASTGSSRRWLSSRRRRRSPIRHCGWAPGAPSPSGKSRNRATSSCSTSTPPSKNQKRVISDEAICAGALYGTPDAIAVKLEVLREAGAEYVLLNSAGGPLSLRRFAHEVRPAFADASTLEPA